MKILFLCNKSPWPPKEGGSMAMNQLIEGLIKAGHSVKVLAVNSEKYHTNKKDVPQKYVSKTGIEWVELNLLVRVWPAFIHFISGKSYHVARFVSEAFRSKLLEILKAEHFDIVQLETLFLGPYIPVIRANSTSKIVLRQHNVEHIIWKRMYLQNRFSPKGIYFYHLYKTLKNYELNIIDDVDAVLPITEKDAGFFREHTETKIQTIPFGIDIPKEKDAPEPENALFYIGAMNWMPNIEGLRWFLKNVWPALSLKFPKLKFYIAGREMPSWLLKLKSKNIVVLGEVEDAEQFVRSKKIAVVPILSGSGIRVKIIESMSLGKAVVSTSTGAEGIDYENGKNIFIADTAEAFIQDISILYTQPETIKKMGQAARKLIAEQHRTEDIIRQLTELYRKIL